jgi:dTDP-3-amino-3,4,6-trideoxy-alpha-D-glucose transaminase
VEENSMKNVPFFDLGRLISSEKDQILDRVSDVIDSGVFIGGETLDRFERDFSSYVGAKFTIGVGNGLDAIRLMLESHGIGPGDEIIVPGFTYYATWLGIMQTGATLVPVDVDINTGAIDVSCVQAAITSKTKAVLAVHLFGHSAEMLQLSFIVQAHGLLLFEDAAQCHGLDSQLGRVGSYADATAFSFYPTKNLGGLGDGGAVTTNAPLIADRIVSRRSYGQGQSKYDHVDTGWNSRLDPIQASILSLHLTSLDSWNDRRRTIAGRYLAALGEKSYAALGRLSLAQSVWHHFVLRVTDRDAVKLWMLEKFGVSTDIHYPYSIKDVEPVQKHISRASAFRPLPVSIRLAREVISLPIGPWMDESDIARVETMLQEIPDSFVARDGQ